MTDYKYLPEWAQEIYEVWIKDYDSQDYGKGSYRTDLHRLIEALDEALGENEDLRDVVRKGDYLDEEGSYHCHDPNTRSSQYHCSNGHEWVIKKRDKCPSCDFGKEERDEFPGER